MARDPTIREKIRRVRKNHVEASFWQQREKLKAIALVQDETAIVAGKGRLDIAWGRQFGNVLFAFVEHAAILRLSRPDDKAVAK